MRDRLGGEGILATLVAGKIRMVTHQDVSREDVEDTLAAWRTVAAAEGAA